jgi:hypothetical protein
MTTSCAVNAMCVTPFDAGDHLDEDALAVIVDWLAAAGVGVYLGSFGTGEGHLLRPSEIDRLYQVGVEAAAGRVPVYGAALGFTSTDQVIDSALWRPWSAESTPSRSIHLGPGPTAITSPDRRSSSASTTTCSAAVTTPVHLTNQVVMVGYGVAGTP